MTIWKYPLSAGRTIIEMPAGAKVLCCQAQGGAPCLWALVNTEYAPSRRVFHTYGTGFDVPPDLTYVGTFQLSAGALVFHVFEEPQ
jgi:hypothetical protein